jgi:hypothetical protein
MYASGKMRPVETIPGTGEQGRGMMERVDLAIIYCKHICKCHNVPLVQQKYV